MVKDLSVSGHTLFNEYLFGKAHSTYGVVSLKAPSAQSARDSRGTVVLH